MRKILLLACVCMLCAGQAMAANCKAGTEVTGVNGHVYCKSNQTMNVWSGATWCEAQGRHLASMEEMCPDTGEGLNNAWDGSTGSGKCANLRNAGGWICSSTASSTWATFCVTSGQVGSNARKDTNYAFCY